MVLYGIISSIIISIIRSIVISIIISIIIVSSGSILLVFVLVLVF